MACLAMGSVAAAAAPDARARTEIEHLMSFLEKSGCQFYRNGSWYDSREARAHLEKKASHLLQRSLIRTADDFIDLAATSSSVTGQPYRVRCGSGATQPSGDWLRAELRRYRNAR